MDKFVIPIAIIILAFYKFYEFRRSPEKPTFGRALFLTSIEVILIAIIVPLGVNRIDWYLTRNERQKTEELVKKNQELMNKLIIAIVDKATDSKDLNELIALKYKEVFSSSKEDARVWAENFIANLPQREKEKARAQVSNATLSFC